MTYRIRIFLVVAALMLTPCGGRFFTPVAHAHADIYLSFRADLSRPYVSQLERNLKSPTVATLFLICDALDVSAAEIVGRVDATRKRKSSR